MHIRTIKKIKDLKDKRVLIRVDYNVPLHKSTVLDNVRIKASLDTIDFFLHHKAKVILITHIGRPNGKVVSSLRVKPVARELSRLLKRRVKVIRTGDWSRHASITRLCTKVRSGSVAMCDNIRFASGEESIDIDFSTFLSSLADVYVLDGFGVAHRESASVTGIATHMSVYAGLSLEREIIALTRVQEQSSKQSVLVIGGAKMETKIPVITHFRSRMGVILVGGGIANTYFFARGYEVGRSLIDETYSADALSLGTSRKVVLPLDVVVGTRDGTQARVVSIAKKPHRICRDDEAILDVGPATVRLYAGFIKKADMIVWNGTLGYFEQKPFDMSTRAIARLIGARSRGSAYGVVGGGETIDALRASDVYDEIDFVSTGGGAMLEFLSEKKLPGIEVVLIESMAKSKVKKKK